MPSTIAFAPAVDTPIPWQNSFGGWMPLAAADLNGDGRDDLVISWGEQGVARAHVLLAHPDGTFPSPGAVPNNATPARAIAADLDGDGRLDLAISDPWDKVIAVLHGNGDGTVGAQLSATALLGAGQMAAADLDCDGRLDLVVNRPPGTPQPGSVSVLRGNGDGTFQMTRDFAAGPGNADFALADFDGDGALDLALSIWDGTDSGHNLSTMLGHGDGTFGPPTSFGKGWGANALVTNDFNSDGKADLALVEYPGYDAQAFLGSGAGSFQLSWRETKNMTSHSVAADDFDGDGIVDLAVAQFNGDAASIFLGQGDGTFHRAVDVSVAHEPGALVVGDWNGDGKPDLALTSAGNILSVLINRSR